MSTRTLVVSAFVVFTLVFAASIVNQAAHIADSVNYHTHTSQP